MTEAAQVKFQAAWASHQRGAAAEALALYREVLELDPRHFDALHLGGIAAAQTGARDEAAALIGRALAVDPSNAVAHYNLGNVQAALGAADEALASYAQAIALKPDYGDAMANRDALQKAVARHAAERHNARGAALLADKHEADALKAFDEAAALSPDYAEAHHNRGVVLAGLRRTEEAIEAYARAAALKPDYPFLAGTLLHTRMTICDWTGLDSALADLLARVARGEKVSSPFPLLLMADAPAAQHKAAQTWAHAMHPRNTALGPVPARPRQSRIRVGYFSKDYFAHPTSQLIAGLFEAHDRSRFETIALSFGPEAHDALRRRVECGVDQFIDVREKTDVEIAALSRALGIDIAVDLAGYTYGSRTGIFAAGAAPIQATYLGYPGTMGSDYYDYVIADTTIVTDAARPYFTEKVVRLPYSYQANDTTRAIDDHAPTRAAAGLPAEAFVFSCHNNTFKFTPAMFDVWMRIVARVPGSVLWLFEDNATASRNLRREAAARGIDPARLIFARRAPQGVHLARQPLAELFLDSLPCNAHTTASDALWMGLPLLTQAGQSLTARVAAGLLAALDLPELVTTTTQEYEDRAGELAQNPGMLRAVRDKLARNRLTQPLFDPRLFARHMESAYTQMCERYWQGLAPDHIDIAAEDRGNAAS